MITPVRVAIALGSNLGNRSAHLEYAVECLRVVLADLLVSRFFQTEPVGVIGPQPSYLNAAVTGSTELTPRALLAELQCIEQERGRERLFPGAARTLDLDLILFGDRIVADGALTVPHPRFRERRFVLEPLSQIAPHMIDPVSGLTIAQLAAPLLSGHVPNGPA